MNGCSCERCAPDWSGMRVCLACGDKRCGRVVDHAAVCGPTPDRDEVEQRVLDERERARRIRLAADVTREAQAVAGSKLDTYRRHYATTDEDLKRTAFAHGAAWAVHYLAGKGLLDLPDEGDPVLAVADSGGVVRPYDPFGETR